MNSTSIAVLLVVLGFGANSWSEIDERGNWHDQPTVHDEIQVRFRCDQSVGELQKVMKKIRDACDASLSMEISCSKQKMLEGSFRSEWCRPVDPKMTDENRGCLKILKFNDAPGNPSICVEGPGVYYDVRAGHDSQSTKILENVAKSLSESFEAIGCTIDGKLTAYALAPGSKKSQPVMGFKIPSKNCYLLPRPTDEHDIKPACPDKYEMISLYPVLDARDAKVNRNVCRLKGSSAKKPVRTTR